jgi:hypothetical protein
MRNFYKISTILIIFMFMFSGLLIRFDTVKAIKNFTIISTSRKISENSEYKFSFTIEKTVELHNYIKMILPAGSKFEKTPIDPPKSSDPFASCYKTIIEYQDDKSVLVQFISRIVMDPSIPGYKDINITIPRAGYILDPDGNWYSVKFFNPTVPGKYTYKMATESEPELVESLPINFIDQPEIPDNINANIWFSNPVKDEITKMLIHIPLQVNEMCCFEFKMFFPVEMLDMTTYLTKDNAKSNFDFITEHVFINDISLKNSASSIEIIGLTKDNNGFYIQIVPINKEFKDINILFDKALEIKFSKEGIFHISKSSILMHYNVAGKQLGKEINLQFQDTFVFPDSN